MKHILMNLQSRSLILFDLDGTLVDSAPDLYRAMNLALKNIHRPTVTYQQILTWIGKGAAKLCECVILYQDGAIDDVQCQQLLTEFLTQYQQNICVDSVVYAGVIDFLQYCQQQGKQMAVVTNKPYQAAVLLLQHLKLIDFFALVVGGDSLAQRKPKPEPLLYAVHTLGQQIEQTLMIGDSQNDIQAANAAGIDCIVLSYGYNHGVAIQDCHPQLVIDQLTEFLEYN